MFFRGKYVDGGDGRETSLKRQRLIDEGISFYGEPPATNFMYNPPAYSYVNQPPAFPVVRLRGLPFDCSETDISEFFHGLDIVDILFVHKHGKFSGEGFCVLGYAFQVEYALQKNRQNIGKRYVEVFRSDRQEYYRAISNVVSDARATRSRSPRRGPAKPRAPDPAKENAEHTGVIRLRGLPFSADRDDIMEFFKDWVLLDDSIIFMVNSDGKVTGEAYVRFQSPEDSKAAMVKDNMSLGSRYIELFPSTVEEWDEAVTKGRIRSAFAFGAKTLARLLDCPKENLVTEINQFFTNTWVRHGNGIRPDAPVTDSLILTQISDSSSKKSESIGHETEFNDTHSSNYRSESSPKVHANKGQRNLKSGLLVNDIQRSPFARTRSSPELTDTYKYVPFQGTRNKPPENEKNHNRRKNAEPENEKNEHSSLHHAPPHQSFEASNVESNIYHREDMHQEEQDLVNLMASSQFHGFNGPVNLASGQLPFPISPSFLASLGYTQRNFPGMIPTNMPFIDPQFSGMQFPHGLVPHYFPGVGMNSNSEDSVDQFNENNLADDNNNNNNNNHDLWREPDRVNSEIVPQDDKPQSSSSTGMNYVPPPRRVGGSGGLVRNQQKNSKEKRERLRDNNHLDHHSQYSDERATSSRFSSAAHSNSLKSKTSSESSWDETSSTVIKSTKEKRGKKTVNPIDDRMQSEDDDQDWVRVPPTNLTSDSESQTVAQTSGSGPVIPVGPMGPMIIGSNPRQRMMDNSGGTPLTFYPTGPPVPFLTMLPFYNVPSENGVDQSDISPSFHPEGVDQSEEFSLRETPDGNKSDILNSDFASHWQNLQFGRFCQSPRHHGPMVYPSPVMVPPGYLQSRVPWDGPGRPVPNANLVTQLMNYGPRVVPVAPPQSVPSRPPNVYQHYVEDMPRYRSGTGTYLPNPKVGGVRERPRRGNYNHEKSDNHGDREGNWTANSKSRGNGRSHNRNQMDKSTTNRLDRLGSSGSRSMNSNSHRQHDSFSGSSQSGPPLNMTYGMYHLPGVPNSGSNGPAVVMVYPYEQNAGFSPQSEQQQLEFGSFGSGGYSGMNEQQSPRGSRGTLEEHNRLYGPSTQRSSPDQPSSPHHHRRV